MSAKAELFKRKYAAESEVRQLILVRCGEGSRARLELYGKEASRWRLELECAALIGKNGPGRQREGDGKTPLGDFGLICGFGIKSDPGTHLPYVPVTENTWCCGDEAAYNRIIDISALPHVCRGERMADYAPEYNYGIFFDYNAEGIPGRGFAIFLHCRGEKPYTEGCIAVDEADMIRLLKSLDTGARLCIYRLCKYDYVNRVMLI